MKYVYNIGRLIASITAGMLLANAALAHDAGSPNNSYVGDSQKHYLTHSTGDCVRTGHWHKEDQSVDCGAMPVAKAPATPPPPPPAPRPPSQPSYETFSIAANALFDHDSATLKSAGITSIQAMNQKIKNRGAQVIDIDVIGHTDSTGSADYNQGLSMRRATAVRDFMVREGLDAGIIDVSGKGESSPIASNGTREGRAENRRVDIRVGMKARKR